MAKVHIKPVNQTMNGPENNSNRMDLLWPWFIHLAIAKPAKTKHYNIYLLVYLTQVCIGRKQKLYALLQNWFCEHNMAETPELKPWWDQSAGCDNSNQSLFLFWIS